MKKKSIQFLLLFSVGVTHLNTFAISDEFYSSGEDLDYLFEADSNYTIEEIEYELRKFILYRKLEDFIFNLHDEYPETN